MNKFLFITIYVCLFMLLVCVITLLYMYSTGGIYVNKIKECKKDIGNSFCGLSTFAYTFPKEIKDQLLALADNTSIAKRVNIPNWKAGKTISTGVIQKHAPDVINWYNSFDKEVSKIVGESVSPTSLELPTSCSVLIYDEENDFINWHFDVNYFNGRFFTVLLPITKDETCTKFVYRDAYGNEKDVNIIDDLCVVFEGDNLFHKASKLCKNQKRAILSLQYSTKPTISVLNRMLMRLKDIAYIG